MKHCIEIQHLKKSFGDIHAADDISLHVKDGELFALLGINGAGKSTTIHMICGQLRKDSGSIIVDGYDLEQDMNKIKELDRYLRAQEILMNITQHPHHTE